MGVRVAAAVMVLILAVATPLLASSPRVHVHLGWWWYPGWWWGATWSSPGVPPLDRAWTVVDTDVSPEQALVYLDGKLIGTADDFDGFPDYLYLRPPGRYVLEFRLGGWESATITVDAAENRFVPVNLKLVRTRGEARAAWYQQPPGLPVGRFFEKEPTAAKGSQSAPLSSQGRPDPSLRPDMGGGAGAQPAATAVLILVVQPDTAAVYVDGQFVGTAAELARLERGLAVSAGHHVVEVLAPGFAARTVTVEVEDGARQQVVVELDPLPGEGTRQNRTEVLYFMETEKREGGGQASTLANHSTLAYLKEVLLLSHRKGQSEMT